MKKLALLSAALAASGLCAAQEVGRVISSTPVVQQVAVPRQVCNNEPAAVQQPKSGAGALMGALVGGVLGNAVGGGAGKAAATAIGMLGGAAVGDSVEGSGGQVQNAQRCRTQSLVENRITSYNVVYEYAGKQYSVQLPNDPGPSLQLQLTPVGAANVNPPAQATVTYAQPVYPPAQTVYTQPVYTQPNYVVVASDPYPPTYPTYYYQPNYVVPFALGIGLGYWINGGRSYGHGRGHWR